MTTSLAEQRAPIEREFSASEERMRLHDAVTIVIRPLVADDMAAIASWFAGLGEETRYARFFSYLKRLDRRLLAQLAHVDHIDHEAIAAVAPDGATIGIARYIRTSLGTAEVAVAVADGWRGQGIACVLLDWLAAKARSVGIDCLVAWCLASNHAVIRVFSRIGPITVGPANAGIVNVRIDLTRPPDYPNRAGSGFTRSA